MHLTPGALVITDLDAVRGEIDALVWTEGGVLTVEDFIAAIDLLQENDGPRPLCYVSLIQFYYASAGVTGENALSQSARHFMAGTRPALHWNANAARCYLKARRALPEHFDGRSTSGLRHMIAAVADRAARRTRRHAHMARKKRRGWS